MIIISFEEISDNITLSNINKHIILEYNWLLRLSEYSISNSKIFNEIAIWLQIKSDLKLSALMFVGIVTRTGVIFDTWDHKVIYYFTAVLLLINWSQINRSTGLSVLIKLIRIDIHCLLTSKVRDPVIRSSIRMLTYQSKRVDLYNLSFGQTCWTEDFQIEFGCLPTLNQLLQLGLLVLSQSNWFLHGWLNIHNNIVIVVLRQTWSINYLILKNPLGLRISIAHGWGHILHRVSLTLLLLLL